MSKLFDDASLAMIPSAYKDGKLYSIRPVPEYGAELVTNGDFATDSDWSKTGGWTISGGTANCAGTGTSILRQTNAVPFNTKFYVSLEVKNYVSGVLEVKFAPTQQNLNVTGNGIYTIYTNGDNNINQDIQILSSNFIGSVDNVSVKEVLSPSGDFTFSRGSNLAATRVDVNGLIEKGRENILLQSNQFDTTWSNSATLTSGESGYDGSSDAWLLTKTAAGDRARQVVSSSGVNTFSVYAKANTLNWIYVRVEISNLSGVYFDLNPSTTGSRIGQVDSDIISYDIQEIGNDWFRCSVSVNNSVNSVLLYGSDISGGAFNSNLGSIYIQDAQLEQSMVATDYIETGASTAQAGILEDMPRLDYSGSCPALLLEPQRSNVVTQSEYFDSSQWTNYYSTISSNDSTSPDGFENATRWTSTASGTFLTTSLFISDPSNLSVFVKYVDHPYIQLYSGASGGDYANFDIQNNTIGTSGYNTSNEKIESYGNGWYRISCTFSNVSAGSTARIGFAQSLTSNWGGLNTSAAGDVLIYGAQVESGSYPTSYIPTYGSSVTRSGDVCVKSGITSLIGQTEGTFFIECEAPNFNPNPNASILSTANSVSNSVAIIYKNNKKFLFSVFHSSVRDDIESSSTFEIGDRVKIAMTYSASGMKLFINGQSQGTNTDAISFNGALSELRVIDQISVYFGFPHKSTTDQVILFKTPLTDSECIALTTL